MEATISHRSALGRRRLLERAVGLIVLGLAGGLVASDQSFGSGAYGVSPAIPPSIVGVHTRLSEEVEPWKIFKTLQMARDMGCRWIVELFPWAYVEPRQGSFDWAHADFVVQSANALGLELIARLDYVPGWARPANSTPRLLTETHYPDYVNFVAEFAHRYHEAIQYFVIWNEPNTSFEWGFRPVNAASYVKLLALAATTIRNVHPGAKILPAGLAPTLEKSDLALEDVTFLQQMYDLGAAKYFDILCAHNYGWKFPPDDPARPDRLNFARVELLHQVMEKNGDGAKPVIITESGWNDSPRWTKSVHPGQRIVYTVRAYQKALQEWPWLKALNMWVFRLPTIAHDYNDYFTFVAFDFRPKPIYYAVQKQAGQWTRQQELRRI